MKKETAKKKPAPKPAPKKKAQDWPVVPIATAGIRENDWNGPRVADNELIASVEENGILQPVCVMPDEDGYRLVYGARRLDAARKAGLDTVPAIVCPASTPPESLRALNLVENIHREPQSPLQEGRIFAELVKMGESMKHIAKRVGKSERFVRRRLALTGLCTQAERIVTEDGAKYDADALAMLAKLPPSRQVDILERNPLAAHAPDQMAYEIRGVGKLDGAQFDPTDERLVPAAGPCSKCPKRTGADKLLFDGEDWEGDTCLDEECFKAKTSAHVGREIAKIRKKHPTAKVWVDPNNYNFSTKDQKEMYDAHGAVVMKDWRIAFQEADKAHPEAEVGILIEPGGAREVVVVPAPRQKDGRAAKPKSPEEKAEYLKKKRAAWIAEKTRERLDRMYAKKQEAFAHVLGAEELGDCVLAMVEAIWGTLMDDNPYSAAASVLFNNLLPQLRNKLYTGSIFAIDPDKLGETVGGALAVTDPDDPDGAWDELLAEAEREVTE